MPAPELPHAVAPPPGAAIDPALWRTAAVEAGGYRHPFACCLPPRAAAPPVLAFHGFGTSGYRTYRFLAPHLWEAGIPLYAPDLLGFGDAEKPTGAVYSLQAYAGQALAVADALGLDRPVVMGHSMGAKVAAAAAACYPERFGGLVLVNPGGFSAFARWMPYVGGAGWVLRLFEHDWFYRRLLPRTPLGAVFSTESQRAEFARLRHSHAALDLDASGVRARLPALRTPALLLWGDDDRLLPHSSIRQVRAALPHVRVTRLPGAGHAPMKDCPERFTHALAAFLRDDVAPTR